MPVAVPGALGPGGGVGPHGASPYDFDRKSRAAGKFPEYYDGSVLFGTFTRDYLREIRLDSRGDVFKINNALNCGSVNVPPQPPTVPTPERPFDCDSPIDMKFGPDVLLYQGRRLRRDRRGAALSGAPVEDRLAAAGC